MLTHEVTHVSIGKRTTNQHGNHPPDFWREVAFNALLVRDSLQDGELKQVFPDADVDRYLKAVVIDPNFHTVDRRYWSVEECRNELAKLLDVELSDIDGDEVRYRKFDTESAESYHELPYKDRVVVYTASRDDHLDYVEMVDLPGIGERTVEKIGPEYTYIDEMVQGTELDSRIAEIVPARYHDDLWARIRSFVDYKHQPENEQFHGENWKLVPPKPSCDIYFSNGNRILPTEEELKEEMTIDESVLNLFSWNPPRNNYTMTSINYQANQCESTCLVDERN